MFPLGLYRTVRVAGQPRTQHQAASSAPTVLPLVARAGLHFPTPRGLCLALVLRAVHCPR